MSSKVRVLYYSVRHGRHFAGAQVYGRLHDDLYNYTMKDMPPAIHKSPKWQQIQWMFEHLPPKGQGKLLLYREPRRVLACKSPYQSFLKIAGISDRRWTTSQLLVQQAQARERTRRVTERIRQQELLGTRRAPDAPRNVVPEPNQTVTGRSIRFARAAQETTTSSWARFTAPTVTDEMLNSNFGQLFTEMRQREREESSQLPIGRPVSGNSAPPTEDERF